jgi:hypothetical protein
MDSVSVISTDSDNSSCSSVSYEGTEGYISEGDDPFFEPIELDSDEEAVSMPSLSSNDEELIPEEKPP